MLERYDWNWPLMKPAEDHGPEPKSFSLHSKTDPNPRPPPQPLRTGHIQTKNISDSINSKLGFITSMACVHNLFYFYDVYFDLSGFNWVLFS